MKHAMSCAYVKVPSAKALRTPSALTIRVTSHFAICCPGAKMSLTFLCSDLSIQSSLDGVEVPVCILIVAVSMPQSFAFVVMDI